MRYALLLVLLLPTLAFGAMPVVENSSYNEATTGDSAWVTKPTSLASGELVVLLVASDQNNPGLAGQWTTPSGQGFTKIHGASSNGADVDGAVFYKVAGGSEPAEYFVNSTGGGGQWFLWAIRISGQHATPLEIDGPSATSVGTNMVDTSLTTTNDSCLAFYWAGHDGADGFAPSVAGTGWVESEEEQVGLGAAGMAQCWGTKPMIANGATLAATVTFGSSDGNAGGQFVIRGTYEAGASDAYEGTVIIIQ